MNNVTVYYEIPDLSGIYLEDSYVIGINECDNNIIFDLYVVLTEKHKFYKKPKEKEYYCYRKAKLIFLDIQYVNWIKRDFKPTLDVNNEVDYGNIDSLILDNGTYLLEGDWGEVAIKCESIKLDFYD